MSTPDDRSPFATPAGVDDAPRTSGPLLAIGGAEDKLGKRRVLTEFVALAGGDQAVIAVIATASSLGPEIVEVYDALFRRLGAKDVVSVRPETREEANSPEMLERLRGVSGVFMTGGNQLKLSAVITGTTFADELAVMHQRGVVIAGTSAGASIQSSHMVAFGPSGATPKQRMTQLAAGLGLIENCVIDQHFEQRNRYGRLLTIVAQSPSLLCMGVDEDTAAVITHEDGREMLRVLGRGAVHVFDGTHVVSNAYEAQHSKPLLASGVQLHVLPYGSVFDLTDRVLVTEAPTVDPKEKDELAVAGRDLRKLARDIAAGDVSTSQLRRRRARRSNEGDPA